MTSALKRAIRDAGYDVRRVDGSEANAMVKPN
jgi:hypothetical protein